MKLCLPLRHCVSNIKVHDPSFLTECKSDEIRKPETSNQLKHSIVYPDLTYIKEIRDNYESQLKQYKISNIATIKIFSIKDNDILSSIKDFSSSNSANFLSFVYWKSTIENIQLLILKVSDHCSTIHNKLGLNSKENTFCNHPFKVYAAGEIRIINDDIFLYPKTSTYASNNSELYIENHDKNVNFLATTNSITFKPFPFFDFEPSLTTNMFDQEWMPKDSQLAELIFLKKLYFISYYLELNETYDPQDSFTSSKAYKDFLNFDVATFDFNKIGLKSDIDDLKDFIILMKQEMSTGTYHSIRGALGVLLCSISELQKALSN